MKSLLWVPVAGLCFASCGDDTNKNVARGQAGEGGEGGVPDPSSGGTEANPSNAGQGGEFPLPAGGGTGAVGGEGGIGPVAMGGAGGAAELVCFQPAPGGGGAGGDPYGGAQWKDHAAQACRACPAADVVCDDLVLDPGATYDNETGVLTLQLGPGKSEIVSADFIWYYYDPILGMYTELETTPVQVDENKLTIQVGPLPSEPSYIEGDLDLRDGCGDQKLLGDNEDWFGLRRIDPPAGGAGGEAPVTYEVTCDYD